MVSAGATFVVMVSTWVLYPETRQGEWGSVERVRNMPCCEVCGDEGELGMGGEGKTRAMLLCGDEVDVGAVFREMTG